MMTPIYLLTDQHQNYLSKEGLWISPDEARSSPASLFRTTMKDEAINQKVEYIVKNPELRIRVATGSLIQGGKIELEADEVFA